MYQKNCTANTCIPTTQLLQLLIFYFILCSINSSFFVGTFQSKLHTLVQITLILQHAIINQCSVFVYGFFFRLLICCFSDIFFYSIFAGYWNRSPLDLRSSFLSNGYFSAYIGLNQFGNNKSNFICVRVYVCVCIHCVISLVLYSHRILDTSRHYT